MTTPLPITVEPQWTRDVTPARVVIVDDCADVRFVLGTVVELDGRFRVVAEADDEPTALVAVAATDPDLVLVDLRLGRRRSGMSIVRELTTREVGPCVVVVTASTVPDDHARAYAAGANGVLDKTSMTSTMVNELTALVERHRATVARLAGQYSVSPAS